MAPLVRVAASEDDRRGCFDVRMTVFVEEQRVPPDEELDADDERALHLVLVDGERAVGTARLLDKGGGVGKIGRVAILPEYRGRGLGRELMLHAMAVGFERHDTLVLDAQLYVIPFYEKLGFAAEGGVFMDAGIPHRRMTLTRPVACA